MRIRILWVGKTKNSALATLASDYLDRARHLLPCDILEIRDVARGKKLTRDEIIAEEALQIEQALNKGGLSVALDESGRDFTSRDLAAWLESEMNRGTREIDFIIGGAKGLSPDIISRSRLRLSLGRMTWTHEMCRVLLLEQIYRALSIIRNLPYHK